MSSRAPRLIFLYGPPAVGKLTVARAIARRSGFRILHNHLTIDPVAEVLTFGTPVFWEVVGRLRIDLLGAAARDGVDLVYTYVFAPGDEPHVERAASAYEIVGGSVLFVRLFAPPEELLRRVASPDRCAHGKPTDPEMLRSIIAEHRVFETIRDRDSLAVDLGSLSADDAAARILEALS